MSLFAAFLIFLSAAFHVTWNLFAKKDKMSIAFYALLCSCSALIWGHIAFWTPVRISQLPGVFWFWFGGTMLSELLYASGLSLTYRRMEMVTAYPLVRSLPILLTALVTTCCGLGTPLAWPAYIGFFIAFLGALLMPLARFSDLSPERYVNAALPLILLTACGTTGYTICDKMAQQALRSIAGETPALLVTLSYYSLRAMTLASTMWLALLLQKRERENLKEYWHKRNWHPVVAGLCGSLTYILVLVAMNFVTNVSFVQLFRQIGLPLGMAAGCLFLKEKATPVKWLGVLLILLGLAVSVLG